MAQKDAQEAEQIATTSISALRTDVSDLNTKIARLTDLFLEQDIDRSEYLNRKRVLQDERRAVEDKILKLERNATHWLEPLRSGLVRRKHWKKSRNRKTLL
jgi:peptidoglycan hydrolase CwlO-like protein